MKSVLTSLLLLSTLSLFAQNLVPNPGFEQYNNCPGSFGMIPCPLFPPSYPTTVIDWISAAPNSPDYYNACSKSNYATVPNHFYGNYPAHNGNAYVGIAGYSGFTTNSHDNSYAEYVECKLSQPLKPGKSYTISCYVQLAYRADPQNSANIVALQELGAALSLGNITSHTTPLTNSFTPLKTTTGGFINGSSWIYISGIYKASGGEQWLTLGVFNDDNILPAMQHVYPPTPKPSSSTLNYYLVDDVSVIENPNCDTSYRTDKIMICNKNSFPENLKTTDTSTGANYVWSNGATSSNINISSAGTYWCRSVKGCSLTVDTFHITLHRDTTYTSRDTVVCANTTTLLSSRANAISYQWNTGDTLKDINTSTTGKYWCSSVVGCTLFVDTIIVKNKAFNNNIELGDDIYVCKDKNVTIGKFYPGNKTYSWNTGQNVCCISPKESGTYILTVKDECTEKKDSINIDFYNCKDCFIMPNAFSPNNDGLNDAIRPIPRCDIDRYIFRIYNRWGQLVFETKDINERWDGRHNNRRNNSGTFFYYIQYTLQQDNNVQTIKGDITLLH